MVEAKFSQDDWTSVFRGEIDAVRKKTKVGKKGVGGGGGPASDDR
jgi:hypothetical protein